jgi:hypothetical protein
LEAAVGEPLVIPIIEKSLQAQFTRGPADVITDFYSWLASFTPAAQLAIALIFIAGLIAFLVVFLRTPAEPRRVRWVVSVVAALLASLIAVVIVSIVRLAWDL